MKKKILLFFVFVFVICSAWCISVSALLPQLSADDSVSLIEPASVTQTNTYYIAFMTDGQMITNDSFSLAKSIYSTTGSNVNREWDFEPVGDGSFYICSKGNSMMYLTANPSSSTVYLDALTTGNSNQKWLMVTGGGQNSLATASTDSRISGKKLYYNNGFQLSSTTFSVVGFFDKSLYIPCTAIDVEDFLISIGDSESLTNRLIYTPSNANGNGAWLDYSSSNPDACTINSSGVVTGVSAGVATITVTNRISKATGSFTVYVGGYPTNILIYYDEAFKYLCNTDFMAPYEQQINLYFQAVKQRYHDLNINLTLYGTSSIRSYPETLSGGNPICPNALNPNAECVCGSVCLDSYRSGGTDVLQQYHHKNAYNIFYRIPAPNTSQHLTLLLSGHNACQEGTGSAHSNAPLGIAWLLSRGSAVVFVNAYNGNGYNSGLIQKTMAHEIGHWFGVTDHYGGDAPSTNEELGQSEYCIWGERRNDLTVYEALKMCSYCESIVKQNANYYN